MPKTLKLSRLALLMLSAVLLTSCASVPRIPPPVVSQCPRFPDPPTLDPPQATDMTQRLPADLAADLQATPPNASTTPTNSTFGSPGTGAKAH